jgi:sugar-specific transcriptional regulator TrmB
MHKMSRTLEKFGLTTIQSNIYLFLSQNGRKRISVLSTLLGIPRTSIYEALKQLINMGLIEEILEDTYRSYEAQPLGILRHGLNDKKIQLEHLYKELSLVENQISKLALPIHPKLTIRHYKGVAGARQLFWNTLKSREKLYVYSEWGRGRYLGIEYYKNFVSASKERGVRESVLINPTTRVTESIRAHVNTPVSRTNLQTIRTIPEQKIKFRGETFMYDAIYAQVYLKDREITGFEIESKRFVDTQRAIFETLWDNATPLSKLL